MKKFINNKLTLILGLVLTILLVSGGTFAYFQWQSSLEDKTNVIVSVTDDIKMTINPAAVTKTGMRPTNNCGGEFGMSGTSVVTIDNQTGVLARPRFKLKLKITDKDGNNITNEDSPMGNPYRQYIKYAVAETDGNCTSPLSSGKFSLDTETSLGSGWYESSTLTLNDSDGFPAISDGNNSGVSFNAAANIVTNHTYKVWIWIDENYTAISTGESVTVDKLQDATITVSWSENSTVEQVSGDGTVEIVRPAGEAYAVYSADDTSLRFYRSESPIEEGSTYNNLTATAVYTGFENENYYLDEIPWYDYTGTITTVVFEDEIVPISTAWWFVDLIETENFDLSKLNTSYVRDMSGMFFSTGSGIDSLEDILELDLTHFDTSNVEYMNEMFLGTYAKLIGYENWDVSKVTDMWGMFSNIGNNSTNLTLDLRNWDTSNVTNMTEMFSNAGFSSANISINLSGWDVSNVTDMNMMFSDIGNNSTNLTLDLSDWIVSNITNVFELFNDSGTETRNDLYVDLSGWDLRNTDVTAMLYNFADNALNMYLDLSDWKISTTTNISTISNPISLNAFAYVGDNATGSWSLNVSNWDLTNIADISHMFYSAGSEAQTFNIIGLDTWHVSSVTDMSNMFQLSGGSATTFDIGNLSEWDTSNVTKMGAMFYKAGNNANYTLDLSGWNVCNVNSYSNFATGLSGKIIAPNFGMACPTT